MSSVLNLVFRLIFIDEFNSISKVLSLTYTKTLDPRLPDKSIIISLQRNIGSLKSYKLIELSSFIHVYINNTFSGRRLSVTYYSPLPPINRGQFHFFHLESQVTVILNSLKQGDKNDR